MFLTTKIAASLVWKRVPCFQSCQTRVYQWLQDGNEVRLVVCGLKTTDGDVLQTMKPTNTVSLDRYDGTMQCKHRKTWAWRPCLLAGLHKTPDFAFICSSLCIQYESKKSPCGFL